MTNRREFVVQGAAATLVGGAPVVSRAGATEVSPSWALRRSLGRFPDQAAFAAAVGDDFVRRDDGATFTLTAVKARGSSRGLDQFSLVFQTTASAAADGGIFTLAHAALGDVMLRLEPSGNAGQAGLFRADATRFV